MSKSATSIVQTRFASFADFYPYYLSGHQNTNCRRLHFVGTALVIALVVATVVSRDLRLLMFIPWGACPGSIHLLRTNHSGSFHRSSSLHGKGHAPRTIDDPLYQNRGSLWIRPRDDEYSPDRLLAGYGCAWAGHFIFEKNRPATFSHPWYSLAADFVLFRDILAGRIRI